MPTQPSQRASSVQSFKVMDVLERANALQAQGHRVLHCEVGQPSTGAPAAVAAAAVTALSSSPHNNLGYTDAFGLLSLRQKIAQHYADKYNLVDDDDIPSTNRLVVTTGSSGAFLLAFAACFDVNDCVAVAASGYPCYRNILQALGVTVCSLPLNAEFKVTTTELRAAVAQRATAGLPPLKGLILSSPSNPTGAMLRPDELRDLCEYCDAHSIQFLSDEIYHGISYGAVPEATALQYSDKVVVINSFSKYYSSASCHTNESVCLCACWEFCMI